MVTDAPFLRPADAAEQLGVGLRRIRQLIRAGEVPATKIGGKLRIPTAAWERWLESQAERALARCRRTKAAR